MPSVCTMLRIPASRIDLTRDDLEAFHLRQAARQSARQARPSSSYVRLSPGPSHPTRLSLISPNQNLGQRKALCSASSEVDDGRAADEELGERATTAGEFEPYGDHERVGDRHGLHDQARGAPGRISLRPLHDKRSSPRHPSGRTLDAHQHGDEAGLSPYTELVDGAQGQRNAFAELPTAVLQRGCPVGGATHASALSPIGPASAPQFPPSLTSSNTRAWLLHSTGGDVQQNVPFPRPIDIPDRHRPELFLHDSRTTSTDRQPVPFVILSDDSTQTISNPVLDPGAPVFVPRTRFGTTLHSSADGTALTHLQPHWGNSSNTYVGSDLRLQSSSERNADSLVGYHHRGRPSREVGREPSHHTQRTQSEQTNDGWTQNAAMPPRPWHLERRPLMRYSSSTSSQRLPSSSLRHSSSQADDGRLLSFTSHTRPPHRNFSQHDFRINHARIGSYSPLEGLYSRTRSASPAVSLHSRSTPNLLRLPRSAPHIGSRESSLSWRSTDSRLSGSRRYPSMVSAVSDGEEGPGGAASRRCSERELDATEEFLRRRNSPLDELTERISRMRSVGRSWERPPGNRRRVSLLTGDPFRQDSSLHQPTPAMPHSTPVSSSTRERLEGEIAEEEAESLVEDVAALSLALPPSTPLAPSLESVASSPPIGCNPATDTSRSALSQLSPSKPSTSSESHGKRKSAAKAVPATPKVGVYNDSLPPNTQPQTPADIMRSTRAKNRSDAATMAPQSPIYVGRAILGQATPAIPERRMHVTAYPPPATATGRTPSATHASAAPALHATDGGREVQRSQRHRRPTHRQARHEEVENELEGHLDGLEEDRRLWMDRREVGGGLESTPPREGRFERYLS
ncbi:hypothetical protein BDY17DRAFT_28502 [Neohortaea acidophila]|uniref:Uncharacterized protein n=1 Tax=Neohortaea acidophila TaxID=245834 RepID=A0A6A6PIS3_9PEZI|nr:uncharacterized protein BDY17DRAFT_28502 [Neohortaea acidophila]KAF2479919.1 hypothetical protein BDY17DRAFT_28502 [Neohortaea acidophila]